MSDNTKVAKLRIRIGNFEDFDTLDKQKAFIADHPNFNFGDMHDGDSEEEGMWVPVYKSGCWVKFDKRTRENPHTGLYEVEGWYLDFRIGEDPDEMDYSDRHDIMRPTIIPMNELVDRIGAIKLELIDYPDLKPFIVDYVYYNGTDEPFYDINGEDGY